MVGQVSSADPVLEDETHHTRTRLPWTRGLATAAMCLAAPVACNSSTGPELAASVGVIGPALDQAEEVVAAPASLRAGHDFTVTVSTFGNGCVTAAGAAVTYHGPQRNVAVVVPFDNYGAPAELVCTDILNRPARDVRLRFNTPGVATIRVEGRRDSNGGRAVVEVPITVVP